MIRKIKNKLDITIAKLFNVSKDELDFILSSFPIVQQKIRDDILNMY